MAHRPGGTSRKRFFALIENIFESGDAHAIARSERIIGRQRPASTLVTEDGQPHPEPSIVEWLVGLPTACVSDREHRLTQNQAITDLEDGVPSSA